MKTPSIVRLVLVIGGLAVFSSAAQELVFDAAAGVITSPFAVSTNGSVFQQAQTGLTNGGRAVYAFTVDNPGRYVVFAEVLAPNESASSFLVSIDGEPKEPEMIWDIPVTTGYTRKWVSWRGDGTAENPQFRTNLFSLAKGSHQLVIRGRGPSTQIKRVGIVNASSLSTGVRPIAPTNLRVVGPQ